MAAGRQRNRQRRRRGRFGVLYKLLSMLIVFTAILVGCVVFFRVNKVEVVGNHRYTAEEVIAASGVKIGDNLFLVNRPRTNSSLIHRLPYVQRTSMVRRLPDTIELHVTESTAAATVEVDGTRWVIDPRGKLLEALEPDASPLERDLPQVLGLNLQAPAVGSMISVALEEQTALNSLQSLLTALAAHDMAENVTDFIDLRATNAIYFGYGGTLTVVVPVADDLNWYAFALQQVIAKFDQQGERVTGTLYLTYGEERASLLTERWLPDEVETKGEISGGTDGGAEAVVDSPIEPPDQAAPPEG